VREIPIGRFGRIVAGEEEGYFLHVDFDAKDTGGYYVYFVDDIDNPSAGGDHWAKNVEELHRVFDSSEWQIEWSDRYCDHAVRS
jgi:hypothetical protein